LALASHRVQRHEQHRLEQALGGIDGRPPSAYIASNTGDSFAKAASASFLIARSGCDCGTRVSGDISTNIDDCFLSSPRIVHRKARSIGRMSIPRRAISRADSR
jgi:hypothetical protein